MINKHFARAARKCFGAQDSSVVDIGYVPGSMITPMNIPYYQPLTDDPYGAGYTWQQPKTALDEYIENNHDDWFDDDDNDDDGDVDFD